MNYQQQFEKAQERERRAAVHAQESRLDTVADRLNLKTFIDGIQASQSQPLVAVEGKQVTTLAARLYNDLRRCLLPSNATNEAIAKHLSVPESVAVGTIAELDYFGLVAVQTERDNRVLMPVVV